MKYPILMLTFSSLLMTSCGFGGKNADPLRDQENSSFVSSSERFAQHNEWERKFSEETKAYNESIKAIEADSEKKIAELETHYQGIEERLRTESSANNQQWQTERASFIADFNQYKTEQNAVILELQRISSQWETQANSCQQVLDNPERQNFQGLLYRYEAQEALPKSIEFVLNSSKSYKIFFRMDLAHSAVTEIKVEPALPAGLTIVRQSDDLWAIEGAPTVSMTNSQDQYRSIHAIIPVIDLNEISDEDTKALIEQQSFEEKVMIVIHKNQIPVVEGNFGGVQENQ